VKYYVHPNYNGKSSYFDVAIFETEAVKISTSVSPVCLPDEVSDDVNKFDNDQAELLGWGKSTSYGEVSNKLKRVSVKVYSQR